MSEKRFKDEKSCSNCRNQMTGWDGGFFGLPFTCECRIYGETENRKNCSNFKKRVTKSDLLNKIQSLEKENEQLKKSEKINMGYAEQIVEENQKLRIAKNDLRIENERLKSRNNYNLEDCLLEIVELKEEKEQLKKKLESLQKVLHLVECVSDE